MAVWEECLHRQMLALLYPELHPDPPSPTSLLTHHAHPSPSRLPSRLTLPLPPSPFPLPLDPHPSPFNLHPSPFTLTLTLSQVSAQAEEDARRGDSGRYRRRRRAEAAAAEVPSNARGEEGTSCRGEECNAREEEGGSHSSEADCAAEEAEAADEAVTAEAAEAAEEEAEAAEEEAEEAEAAEEAEEAEEAGKWDAEVVLTVGGNEVCAPFAAKGVDGANIATADADADIPTDLAAGNVDATCPPGNGSSGQVRSATDGTASGARASSWLVRCAAMRWPEPLLVGSEWAELHSLDELDTWGAAADSTLAAGSTLAADSTIAGGSSNLCKAACGEHEPDSEAAAGSDKADTQGEAAKPDEAVTATQGGAQGGAGGTLQADKILPHPHPLPQPLTPTPHPNPSPQLLTPTPHPNPSPRTLTPDPGTSGNLRTEGMILASSVKRWQGDELHPLLKAEIRAEVKVEKKVRRPLDIG